MRFSQLYTLWIVLQFQLLDAVLFYARFRTTGTVEEYHACSIT